MSTALSRLDFPSDFIFGSGTSASQVEGATLEDGKTSTAFEAFLSRMSGNDLTKGIEGYKKYKEDVQLMVETGLDAYRFSISWSRLIPEGKGPVNPKGLEYYNNLINELVKNGIQPHVTLLHFDVPDSLMAAYNGLKGHQFVEDFIAYAEVCFKEFGDRVLYWTTFNEANNFATLRLDEGSFSPSSEPYIRAHNIILAHASAVKLYREKYKETQHGFVGLNLYASWYFPENDDERHSIATKRAIDFTIGWIMDPLIHGKYPDSLKKQIGTRLPSFTEDESKIVKDSYDFIGLNCYVGTSVEDNPSSSDSEVKTLLTDLAAKLSPKGELGGAYMKGLLEYFKRDYGNPPIYIQENGYWTPRDLGLNDASRIKYHTASIASMLNAMRGGSNVKGYFQWSFLDLLEVFKYSYGLYHVDLEDPDRKRKPKLSAIWYKEFLKGHAHSNGITQVETP
ncbi:cyanidin 3-O-glucoside 5-O-glucosyltransferase (acyl-glucose)-like [Silene latifolia]|uniref:cyanidin 3-O-glucoside 5-O-glucosyltransferase (acyl-glucose)-like n=1 Tax=Silene latifolia TaxID=37657 RepID=UPI003D7899C7